MLYVLNFKVCLHNNQCVYCAARKFHLASYLSVNEKNSILKIRPQNSTLSESRNYIKLCNNYN